MWSARARHFSFFLPSSIGTSFCLTAHPSVSFVVAAMAPVYPDLSEWVWDGVDQEDENAEVKAGGRRKAPWVQPIHASLLQHCMPWWVTAYQALDTDSVRTYKRTLATKIADHKVYQDILVKHGTADDSISYKVIVQVRTILLCLLKIRLTVSTVD